MKYINKRRWQHFLSLFLCTCILFQSSIYHVLANDRSADIIGASPLLVPNLLTSSGLSGKGQIVGIADSGLDNGSMSDIHPDLQSEPGTMPKIVMLKSYTDRELPDDPNGHGTFMAATIAGSGKASQGQYRGIASGASLYFQALLDKFNNLKLPERLEELFRPAYSAGVRIHVNGWGGGTNSYKTNSVQIDDFVYRYPDFLPVFGAGNSGPSNGSLTSEANSKNALVVGSSQVPRPVFGPEARYADQSADSSSRGPTADGRIKPDILAPGSALISANSSLAEGNFAANSFYTRMGGTSMAAAVTGGALALLREQLKNQNIANPSSALLKALLINGARPQTGDPAQEGFGILDLAGTVLALQEGTFKINDVKTGLKVGEIKEYKLQVTDPSLPIKITLAWVDPPAVTEASSALVNNLDLIVQDPSGKSYYGNDFSGQGRADDKNNVEQVSIPISKVGEYIIRVKASSISQMGFQDFALVYGQSLKNQVITQVNDNELSLLDGTKVDLEKLKLHQVVDGNLVNSTDNIQVGSDIYLTSKDAYIFGRIWKTGGIQAVPTSEGDLLLEMNANAREGGYYLDPQASSAGGSIRVNGQPVASIINIPSGAELKASINPFLQTLWKLEASNQEISGFVEQVNLAEKEIKLFHDNHMYKLASWAAISYRDKLLECTVQDTPYGTAEQNNLNKLMPGMKVTMQVSPQTQVVQSLMLERPMVIGRVDSVDIDEEKIVLDSGKTYQIFPGTSLYRNGESIKHLEDIICGDRIVALLMPDSNSIMQLRAFSNVIYGRVVYSSPKQRSMYLIDSNNCFQTYTFNDQTEVFGWGIPLESTSILPGSWVRVIADPTGKDLWRIDLAEIAEEAVKTISWVNSVKKIMGMTDGSQYTYTSSTRISKGGYSINALDIMPGEKVNLTTLLSPSPWLQVLAGVEVESRSEINVPNMEITALSLNGVLIVQGKTTADRLYLYRQDGSTERITVVDGLISRIYGLLDNETELRMVALDTRSGGMKASDLKINVFQPQPAPASFTDISGHWAENNIKNLARRSVVKGYGDGSYHPDQVLSRAELVSIIARMQELTLAAMGQKPNFSDYQDIPWWALEAVLATQEHGLISGCSDGSFQPNRAVTRSEMAVILNRIAGGTKSDKTKPLPYRDWSSVPSWAKEGYYQMYERGLLEIFSGEYLEPDRPVTRAEAAALLDKI
jgi:subtilisin family serine protease